eukprot:scaffold425_cov175-Amphora_coffeaeformis.AAC.61
MAHDSSYGLSPLSALFDERRRNIIIARVMYCKSLMRCILTAARHKLEGRRLLLQVGRRNLMHVRMSSSCTNSLETEATINNEDVLKINALKTRFTEFADRNGTFPLLNKNQTESFKKKVKWSDDDRQAAVLVLVCNVDGKPSILFTHRSAHLSQHAAEISFPGGHLEKSETYETAALRETCEELLPPDGFLAQVQIIGRATKLPSIRGTPVTPVLAISPNHLSDIHELFPGNPNEVDLVFSATVADLVENEGSHVIPNNRFGNTLAPTFATPHGKIWGLTAFILRPLLHKVLKPVYLEGCCDEAYKELPQNDTLL